MRGSIDFVAIEHIQHAHIEGEEREKQIKSRLRSWTPLPFFAERGRGDEATCTLLWWKDNAIEETHKVVWFKVHRNSVVDLF